MAHTATSASQDAGRSPATSLNQRILLIRDPHQAADGLKKIAQNEALQVSTAFSCREALEEFDKLRPAIVIIDCSTSTPSGGPVVLQRLLDAVERQGAACLLLGSAASLTGVSLPDWVQALDHDICAAELFGRLASIQHHQQVAGRTPLDMHPMKRLDRHLRKQYDQVNQDMQLASRLQQEFLPRALPEVDGVRFSTLYRPAGWVSGDTYDVARVDERHLSFYLVDAVGHGMAASLLTMFARRALCSKEVLGRQYRVLPPSEVLAGLNSALADENLMNSLYVTACYCLFNQDTRQLTVARGGHPYPLLIDPKGSIEPIKAEGVLLGLFGEQEFPDHQIQLHPGQKVILYSDGLELAFGQDGSDEADPARYHKVICELAHLPAAELLGRLGDLLDAEQGSINPLDDITAVVMEITE